MVRGAAPESCVSLFGNSMGCNCVKVVLQEEMVVLVRGFGSTRVVDIPNLFEVVVVLFGFKGEELVLRRGIVRACCLGVWDSLSSVDLGLIGVLDLSKLGLCWVYCREDWSHVESTNVALR
ncbi:hypothetical protein Droror1_Dr00003585 [Drosera rotundifolia]